MYRNGHHVSRDYGAALYWYEAVRDAGNEGTQKRIDELNEERRRTQQSSSSQWRLFHYGAFCDRFDQADDCYELTAFRNFRDKWLVNQPDEKNLIAEYYEVAPKIVERIDLLANSAGIYKNIWRDYLSKYLKLIKVGDNQN